MVARSLGERAVDRLEELVAVPSVVGYEWPMLQHLSQALEGAGMEVTRREGVVVGVGAAGSDVMISAHVDRHGLVCTSPGSFTYAAHVLPALRGQPSAPRHNYAEIVCDRFDDEEVRAYDATTGHTVADGRVKHQSVCGVDDLGIDVPVMGLDQIAPATPVAFGNRVVRDNRLVSAQLDNVLGVAMALVLVQEGFDGTVVFSSEEEIGGSWRYLYHEILQHPELPSVLLTLDTSPFSDDEASEAGAVVVRWRDADASFSVESVQRLIKACQDRRIPVVVKDRMIERFNAERRAEGRPELELGHTELGRLVRASGGLVNGATLEVPTTGYHTNEETASLASIDNAMAVLLATAARAI